MLFHLNVFKVVLPEYITEFRHVPKNGQQKTLNMFYSDSANIEIEMY
jgi:hypothetical protein